MFKYIIFILILGALNIGFIYAGGSTWLQSHVGTTTVTPPQVDPVMAEVFIFTLEEEVRKKIGQPSQGYEPAMFLEVFPGLAETDFEGVEASIGYYAIEQGRLTHKLDESKLIHAAAGAVTRRGMETLLHNIAARTNINLQSTGTITDIMSVLIRS